MCMELSILSVKKLIVLSALAFGLLFMAKPTTAAVLTGGVLGEDEFGRPQVTFQTDNWRDMMDTYLSPQLNLAPINEGSSPTISANFTAGNHGTIRFEVTGTVFGNNVWSQIMGNQAAGGSVNQDTIREGRSLYIDGNSNTLYFDNDTTPTNGSGGRGDSNAQGTGGGPRRGWFAGVQGRTSNPISGSVGVPAQSNDTVTITPETRLTLANATVINSITGGVFQARGRNVKPTFTYKDVRYINGAGTTSATPIYAHYAHINFSGTNYFRVWQSGTGNLTGSDNQGEFIEGGAHVEVLDGHTALDYNWGNDQPFFMEVIDRYLLRLHEDAKLTMNLDTSYAMYWSRSQSHSIHNFTWDFQKNSEFLVTSTARTGITGLNTWFQHGDYRTWDFNMAEGARFISHNSSLVMNIGRSNTGGLPAGSSGGWGGFNGAVRWNFGPDSEFIINSPATTQTANNATIAGTPGAGSEIVLNNVRSFTINSRNTNTAQPVIHANVRNFPIRILKEGDSYDHDNNPSTSELVGVGNGLRTHLSTYHEPFANVWDGSFDTADINRRNLDQTGNDTFVRANHGTIINMTSVATGAGVQQVNLEPNRFTDVQRNALRTAGYISFFKPLGAFMHPDLSSMNSTFSIDLASLPFGGGFGNWLEKNETNHLVLGDDRGQKPNFHVTVTMIENRFPDAIKFSWVDFEGERSKPLELNTAHPVISITDNNLPSFVEATGSGTFYKINFAKDKGVQLQARNSLRLGQTHAGIFRYSINDGPGL